MTRQGRVVTEQHIAYVAVRHAERYFSVDVLINGRYFSQISGWFPDAQAALKELFRLSSEDGIPAHSEAALAITDLCER